MSKIRDLLLKKVLWPMLDDIKRVGDDLARRSDQIQPFWNAPFFLLSMLGVLHAIKTIDTHTDQEKCLPNFADNLGSAVCSAVCLFSKQDYDLLKENAADLADQAV